MDNQADLPTSKFRRLSVMAMRSLGAFEFRD